MREASAHRARNGDACDNISKIMSGDDWINVSILMTWALSMMFFPRSIIRLHIWLGRGVKRPPPREMAVRIIGVIVLLVAVITILRAR